MLNGKIVEPLFFGVEKFIREKRRKTNDKR